MSYKRVGLLIGIGALSTMLVGFTNGEANNQSSYVKLNLQHGKVAVYSGRSKVGKHVKRLSLSGSKVYQTTKSMVKNNTQYVKVQMINQKKIGWIKQTAVKKLVHVTNTGQLTVLNTKKASGYLKLKGKNRKVYIDVQGPQGTVDQMTYRHVKAKTLTKSAYQVVQIDQTDFGKYYRLQKNYHDYGWVKATAFKFKTTETRIKSNISTAQLQQINKMINDNHIKGTLLITNNGIAGAQTYSYGYANFQTKTPNTADTVYPIASLQKAMTGVMIEQLIQAKKLSMQDKLSKFYPQVKYANQITIRQLLNHTSGIQMGEPVPSKSLNENEAVQWTLQHLTSTNHYSWNYTNANYTLLAGIISKVTKKSYQSNLQTRIIHPLGMKHAYNWNQLPKAHNLMSYQYMNDDYSNAKSLSINLLSSELGAGNLSMSVGDYEKFVSALQNNHLLSVSGKDELTNRNMGFEIGYGGGYYYNDDELHANGNDNRVSAFCYSSFDSQVSVVFFSNQGNYNDVKTATIQIKKMLNSSKLI
ncbi:serine hydrolase domain-containing protein [Lactiplantibacillus mudanjiangensis]|uniref:Uncharacterized protein n=1 Tax=Lactiplantibacillus mudanjiangensis TaxID=1296538 RepID=A0A660E907_9LACO|nr:serine hydrolase domain-containing protein [Lactiplantibacillus mudanjiangensis]VDG29611.1 hypothetical protein [Lactobacillus sp. CBA3605] [Lactiplantibacillus mudanjiangensis]